MNLNEPPSPGTGVFQAWAAVEASFSLALWIVVFFQRARALKTPSPGKNRQPTLLELSPHALILSFRWILPLPIRKVAKN